MPRKLELYHRRRSKDWIYTGRATFIDGLIEDATGDWHPLLIGAAEQYFDRNPHATFYKANFGPDQYKVIFRPWRTGVND